MKMIVKIIVVLTAAVTVLGGYNTGVLPPEIQDAILPYHQRCVNEVGISEEEIENLDLDNASMELKCYMTCLMRIGDWIGADGELDIPFIEEHYQVYKPFVGKAWAVCNQVKKGPHECDIGYKFNVCYKKVEPEKYYLP